MRLLRRAPKARIAILSHDPSVVGAGALLGDRATMINSQDDRVFMRSMATRGQAGGLSPATGECLALLARSDFDYVIIETVGTGQEAMPFQNELVQKTVLVMNPDYGSRLQLQKIVMLDLADLVVVNKSDQDRARTALSEIEQRLDQNKRDTEVAFDSREAASRCGRRSIVRLGDGRCRAGAEAEEGKMSKLGQVVESVEKYNQFVLDQVKRARSEKSLASKWSIAGTR